MTPSTAAATEPSSARHPASARRTKTLVTIATYNEMENLPRLIEEIFRQVPEAEILVIDDGSPDGTGDWCAEQADADPRLHCIQRSGKLGLGTATIAAMQFAVQREYLQMLNIDADFSHHPRYLPEILLAMEGTATGERPDVVIGSRYISGGRIEGWPLRRHVMSRCVNWLSRCLLRLPTRDCSGAYRCYRVSRLELLDFTEILSQGYSFQEEILWRLKRCGASFSEIPIVFVDRVRGHSKVDMAAVVEALRVLFTLGAVNWFRRAPRG